MVLFTARPEFRPQWPLRSHHAQIVLNRLGPGEIRTMVQELASRALLAAETVDRVVERTGGVPLFVEELTRAVLENGSAKITGREIPATLHDSLMSRLDRLGPAKEVVQIGAVLGGEFSYELLHAVHPIPETELQRHLRSAIDAELVYARGIAPEASYQFKHALIRDAAYEALLKSRRKELHRLIAQTVDGKFPTLKEKDPEMLAHHWSEAGESAAAIVQWERAGKFAEAGNAVIEAEEHYRRALSLVDYLPPGTERDRRQFELQIALGNVVRSSKKPAMAVR
jgi:predicted ATPase